MIFVIGIILFWMSVIGYLELVKNKFNIPNEFILPIVFSCFGIIIFLAGILNVMVEVSVLLCATGIILLIKSLCDRKFLLNDYFNINFLIIIVMFIYFTFICSQLHLLHYDNFSHWALIIKNMFLNNQLPNFETSVIEFKDYQPGSACFIYFFGFLTGKKEISMIVAQNYLLIAFYFSILIFTNEIKNRKVKVFSKILVVVLYLFILLKNITFNDLLVDSLITVIFVYLCCIVYYYRNDLKKLFYCLLPTSIYLFLVKNIGIVLLGYISLMLLFLGFRNKEKIKGIIYCILNIVVPTLFFFIWSKHVSYVFGKYGLYSKHSLSASNIVYELRAKGWDRIYQFCSLYFNHFIDILNNIPNKFIIVINIILIIMLLFYKKSRKFILKFLIVEDFIYFSYYFILGVMYLFSMPWSEASYLAGFDRYMLTIILSLIMLTFLCFCIVLNEDRVHCKISLLLIILFIVSSFYVVFKDDVNFENAKLLLGIQNYEKTIVNKFDGILESDFYNSSSDIYYYVYAPISSKNDFGYTFYLSRYKLNTSKVEIVNDINELDDSFDYDINKVKIIVLDFDDFINTYLSNNWYEKISDNIYEKSLINNS